MGYDFSAKNEEVGSFHLGAFSWPVLVEEAFGTLFPLLHNGAQWYCLLGVDPRMPEGDTYPRLLSNDGFAVTEEEARIMARMARNYVALQRSLPEENRGTGTTATQSAFKREDVERILMQGMAGGSMQTVWPVKIRDDFVDKFEAFAAWAERSGGFEIW